MNKKIMDLKKIIAQNQLRTCLNELTTLIKADQPIFDEIINLFGRFVQFQQEMTRGNERFDSPEINKIRTSLLDLIGNINDADWVEDSQKIKFENNTKFDKIHDIVNPNFENDMKNLEGDWDVANVIGKNTVVIVTGVHFFPEMFDRVSAYFLQNVINKRGEFKNLKRAIVVGDMPYEYAKNMNSELKESIVSTLSVLSIGGPSVNNTSLDIINTKDETMSNLGVNITYKQSNSQIKLALWGNSAYKTMKAVEGFIESQHNGLDWFLSQIWNE